MHAGFPRDLVISFLSKPAKQTLIRKFAYCILSIVRLLDRSFFTSLIHVWLDSLTYDHHVWVITPYNDSNRSLGNASSSIRMMYSDPPKHHQAN